MIRRRRSSFDPFTDLLFNALLGFTFLFMIAVMFINPITRLGAVNLKAEYIITLTWPPGQADDLDLWVEDPSGNVVSYLQRDVGWLHLDRDDRGDAGDVVTVDGRERINPLNQEVVTLRGIVAGEYVVNVYYYESQTQGPVDATVQIDRVNPVLRVEYADQIRLQQRDHEVTVIRFSLTESGEVTGLSRVPKRLTPYNLNG